MFQLVKPEILDKQFSEDPISWAMLWSHDDATRENTVVILPREMFQKGLLSGRERGGFECYGEGGKSRGGGWVERWRRWAWIAHTNPGCLQQDPDQLPPLMPPHHFYKSNTAVARKKIYQMLEPIPVSSISGPAWSLEHKRYSENIKCVPSCPSLQPSDLADYSYL